MVRLARAEQPAAPRDRSGDATFRVARPARPDSDAGSRVLGKGLRADLRRCSGGGARVAPAPCGSYHVPQSWIRRRSWAQAGWTLSACRLIGGGHGRRLRRRTSSWASAWRSESPPDLAAAPNLRGSSARPAPQRSASSIVEVYDFGNEARIIYFVMGWWTGGRWPALHAEPRFTTRAVDVAGRSWTPWPRPMRRGSSIATSSRTTSSRAAPPRDVGSPCDRRRRQTREDPGLRYLVFRGRSPARRREHRPAGPPDEHRRDPRHRRYMSRSRPRGSRRRSPHGHLGRQRHPLRMLAGRPPFDGKTTVEVCTASSNASKPLCKVNRGVPHALSGIVGRAGRTRRSASRRRRLHGGAASVRAGRRGGRGGRAGRR